MPSKQLALPVGLRDDATLANFTALGESGRSTLAQLGQLHRQTPGEPVYLFGPVGSGRSHLLQAVCHLAGDIGLAVAYLPLADVDARPRPEWLEGLHTMDLVALDDVDAVAGNLQWEEALFHLYNRCRESGSRLLLSARVSPAELDCKLADLQSRLAGCLSLGLQPANDDEKILILIARAAARGIQLSTDVADYILKRAPRDMASLMALLDRLDESSLAAGRRVTIPFVRDLLGW